MKDGQDVRRSWRFWGRIAIANVAAAIIVLGFNGVFAEPLPWSRRLLLFGYALVYTTPVSAMLGLGLPACIPRLSKLSWAWQWAGRFIAILVLTAAGLAIASAILIASGLEDRRALAGLVGSFPLAALIAVTISTSITVVETLRHRLDQTTIALRTKELEEERAHKLASEAQLAALESRIHPHFLFNTLNTIAALIQEDPAKAERTVGQLAALLRSALDATAGGSVPLAEELRIVRDYLEIESARFGERLRFEMQIDPALSDVAVPALAVQTLVENAVKHGLSTRRDAGEIRLVTTAADGALVIDVADNGEEFTPGAFPAGHGLDNVRGRLHALFGDAAAVTLARREGWTIASVRVPRGTQG